MDYFPELEKKLKFAGNLPSVGLEVHRDFWLPRVQAQMKLLASRLPKSDDENPLPAS